MQTRQAERVRLVRLHTLSDARTYWHAWRRRILLDTLFAIHCSSLQVNLLPNRMDHLPTYAASSLPGSRDESDNEVSAPPALLNLIPVSGQASFLQGYLGYSASSIQGSLQLKFPNADSASYRSSISKVTVVFSGVECICGSDNDAVELVKEVRTLWEKVTNGDQGTSDGHERVSTAAGGSGPSGNLDFDIRLTDDLPTCCHVGSGSIKYSLTATLHTSSKKALSISTPVHLTRTSPPLDVSSSSATSNEPEVFSCQHPTTAHIYFPHGTKSFRRSESIELRVRVPPPEAVLVQEKGLKLRSISAELHRSVSLRETTSTGDDEEIQPIREDGPTLDTLISHSGKAAAFSSSRSIFLNIWLQPVPAEFCEAISQSTIFLDIRFSVRVIASFQGRAGDREEVIILDQPITIIPDYPPASAADLDVAASGRALQLSDFGDSPPVASSSSAPKKMDDQLLRAFEEETEYDGYEEISQEADPDNAPPSIDADQPPPALDLDGASTCYGSRLQEKINAYQACQITFLHSQLRLQPC